MSDLKTKINDQAAIVYMCGNGATMVRDVEALICTEMNNEEFFKNLAKEGRYKKEVWMPTAQL